MENLTTTTFRTKVFDYEKEQDWNFLGEKPTIIDFYADWCGPCKLLTPILEEIQKEYDGKINIYKVNTESESELSAVFKIRSIPTLLFIPMQGPPQMANGLIPKEKFDNIIKEVLLVK
jgi:thioredoxin 1